MFLLKYLPSFLVLHLFRWQNTTSSAYISFSEVLAKAQGFQSSSHLITDGLPKGSGNLLQCDWERELQSVMWSYWQQIQQECFLGIYPEGKYIRSWNNMEFTTDRRKQQAIIIMEIRTGPKWAKFQQCELLHKQCLIWAKATKCLGNPQSLNPGVSLCPNCLRVDYDERTSLHAFKAEIYCFTEICVL